VVGRWGRREQARIIQADAGIHLHWPPGRAMGGSTSSNALDDRPGPADVLASGRRPARTGRHHTPPRVPMVSPDGRGIYYASDRASQTCSWRPLPEATQWPDRGVGDYWSRAWRPTGGQLSRRSRAAASIAPAGPGAERRRSTRCRRFSGNLDPSVSPRGNLLVFSSSRNGDAPSGCLDWCPAAPADLRRRADQVRSPDERQVAFVRTVAGVADLADFVGGGSRDALVDAESLRVSWSRDRRVVYR
jgi:hypothetical protein